MNADSSNWKQYIPYSEELTRIYGELETCVNAPSWDDKGESSTSFSPIKVDIFEDMSLNPKPSHIEKQLDDLIGRFDNAVSSTETVLDAVNSSITTLDTITKQYDDVSIVTKTLHDECEEYIGDEKSLSRVLNELREPLAYFRDLSVITDKIGMNSLYSKGSSTEKSKEMEYDLYCEELSSIIDRIFECLQFFRSHPSYKDSSFYITKYQALLDRVYEILSNKFSSLLNTCSAQVNEKSDKNQLLVSSTPLYYFFSALSRGNATLINHILQIHSGSYEPKTDSCFTLYCDARYELLKELFYHEISQLLSSSDSLENRARAAILLMIEVCEMESECYLAFFCHDTEKNYVSTVRSSPAFSNSICSFLEDVALLLYEQIRPLVLDLSQLDVLCDLVHMIKMEIVAGDVIKRNSFTSVAIPIIIKLEEDVRERILFIAHLYIDTTIHDYTPTEQDINYPDKLYQFYAQRHRADFSIYAVWYTPVQKVLRILSLLYTCVDYTIMADITAEAVRALLVAISRATALITSHQSLIDGELFRIKTLLILREQISPFDLHSPGTYLPFSDTALHESALYRLFRRAIPTMAFINQDGLRLLEEALKESTNRLIEGICRDVCGTVITLIQQYEQFMAQASSAEDRFPLEEEQVVNMLASFAEGTERLEDTVGKIALYIDSPATQGILFAPVRRILLNNAAHMKEILVHLKPNNFPRYLDQLGELEEKINAIDATKFNHSAGVARREETTVEDELMKEPITPVDLSARKGDAVEESVEGEGNEEVRETAVEGETAENAEITETTETVETGEEGEEGEKGDEGEEDVKEESEEVHVVEEKDEAKESNEVNATESVNETNSQESSAATAEDVEQSPADPVGQGDQE